jgi:hypothetical protein
MASQTNGITISRTTGWIGGVALLLIAVLAGFGNFGVLTPLITDGDAIATAHDIAGSQLLFRVGVLCMAIAAVLDLVVAAALLALLEPVNRMLAVTAAWFRVAYSAVFFVAIAQLASVPTLLDEPVLALHALESYEIVWRSGLMLFGVHLLLVGYLAYRSGFMPRVLGALLAIAGVGYVVDGVGTLLVADFTPTLSTFTFIGEVALIGWFIVTAIRSPRARTQKSTAPVALRR